MQASVSREQALELLELEHETVRALIDELSDEEMTRPDTIRYGLYPDQKCSFKDLLAHLITYEKYSLDALAAWQNGDKHPVCDQIRTAAGGREIHYGGIAERAATPLKGVLDEWEQTQAQLKDSIRALPADAWNEAAPYAANEPTDLGGMLEVILVAPPRPMYRHVPVHIPDSDDYIRSLRRG
jgi:hypothetical protein